jgi:SOS-response transcriptional repressor LexA
MSESDKIVRPTKKQQELLGFIESFITEHGYSPSYREIKSGMGYNSIATVSLHVKNLIARGHLQKREHAARSLEVVSAEPSAKLQTNQIQPSEEKWLIEKIEYYIKKVEAESKIDQAHIDELYVLIGALKILGLDGAAQSFLPRLTDLKNKLAAKDS